VRFPHRCRASISSWLQMDIPATTREIAQGTHSNGVIPRGKPGPAARMVYVMASTTTRTGSPATRIYE
jgi:hypothetical protein